MTSTDQMTELYEKHDINHLWDDRDTYSNEESYNGDGRYPPDWNDRKKAVRDHYNNGCARCRRNADQVEDPLHTHHYQPLGNDGTNELSNLILLCGACHNLMHPMNTDMYGADWTEAPMFPHNDADRRVAVIRDPVTDTEHKQYDNILHALEQCSPESDEPKYSYSQHTYILHPTDAFAADDTDAVKQIITERQDRFGMDDETVHVALENPDPDDVNWGTVSSSLLRRVVNTIGALLVAFVVISLYTPGVFLATLAKGLGMFLLKILFYAGRVVFPVFILFILGTSLWPETLSSVPYNLGYIPAVLVGMLAMFVGIACHTKYIEFERRDVGVAN